MKKYKVIVQKNGKPYQLGKPWYSFDNANNAAVAYFNQRNGMAVTANPEGLYVGTETVQVVGYQKATGQPPKPN